jgi:hypothetical protein
MSEAGGLRHRCTPSPTIKNKKNFRKKFSENLKKIKKISKNKILEKIFIFEYTSNQKISTGG